MHQVKVTCSTKKSAKKFLKSEFVCDANIKYSVNWKQSSILLACILKAMTVVIALICCQLSLMNLSVRIDITEQIKLK